MTQGDPHHVQALKCPSCGASLPEGGDRIECAFCGTIVERARRQRPAPQRPPAVAVHVPPVGRQAARAGGVGCALGFVGLMVALGVVVAFATGVFSSGITLPTSIINTLNVRDAALVVAPSGASPEILGYAYDSLAETYHVISVDVAGRSMRWKSEPLSEDALSNRAIAASDTMVVVTDEDKLVALGRADGARLWEATMSDVISSACRDCLQVVAGHAVALTTDETLQAFDGATGELLWRMPLGDYTGRQLHVVGDQIVVLNRDEDVNGQVLLIDAADGAVVSQFSPACAPDELGYEVDAYADDPVWVDAAARAIVLYSEGSRHCLHRYDLASGAQQWQTLLDDVFYPSAQLIHAGDGRLYFGADQQLYGADPQTGEVQLLVDEEDYRFLPLDARDGVLLARAVRTRGTQRTELWALAADGDDARRLWRREFRDGGPLDPPGELAGTLDEGDQGWTWQLSDAGLAVVTLTKEPRQFTIERVGLRDGVVASSATVPLPGAPDDTLWAPDIIGRSGDTLWVLVDNSYWALDVRSGEKTLDWP